jgi:hypothetical protein
VLQSQAMSCMVPQSKLYISVHNCVLLYCTVCKKKDRAASVLNCLHGSETRGVRKIVGRNRTVEGLGIGGIGEGGGDVNFT